MEDKTPVKTAPKPHALMLFDRNKLSLTGVTDVGSFDEQNINLETEAGALCIKGEGLQITGLNLDTGDFSAEGTVTSLQYSQSRRKNGGFLAKVFG